MKNDPMRHTHTCADPRWDMAYFAECQLATVADLAMTKSTSKSNLDRHVVIAAQMLYRLWMHGARAEAADARPADRDYFERNSGRVIGLFKEMAEKDVGFNPDRVYELVTAWAQEIRDRFVQPKKPKKMCHSCESNPHTEGCPYIEYLGEEK